MNKYSEYRAFETKEEYFEYIGEVDAAIIKMKSAVPADTTDIEMNLENPVGNPCYFTFELVLKDTNETLYTSKMVEPGKAITNVTLSHGLEKGEYQAVIKISTASLEDGSAMNGANVETTLIVQ